MAGRQAGPPAGHRQQRDVERRELRHPGEEIRVAREVDRARALEDEAERRAAHAERHAAALVLRVGRAHGDPADLNRVARRQLVDLPERAAQRRPGAARDKKPRAVAEPPERREVEMVPVEVRDEHRVERPQGLAGERHDAPQVHDAPAQHRIGEQPHAVELDEHGRVADVADRPGRHRRPRPGAASIQGARRGVRPLGQRAAASPRRARGRATGRGRAGRAARPGRDLAVQHGLDREHLRAEWGEGSEHGVAHSAPDADLVAVRGHPSPLQPDRASVVAAGMRSTSPPAGECSDNRRDAR